MSVFKPGYKQGLEDAFEFSLAELQNAKDLQDAKARIERILGLLKEKKFYEIQQALEEGVLQEGRPNKK